MMNDALPELLTRHVAAGTIPGAVALVGAENPEVVTAGVASIGGGPMGADAIVRIQSMTKAITSVAALRLVEAGRLELDQPLVEWLPELADRQVLRDPAAELNDTVPAERAITLRHLLTNTSGYGMAIQASPLREAMAANGTEAGSEPRGDGRGRMAAPAGGTSAGVPAGRRMALSPFVWRTRHPHLPCDRPPAR